MSLNTCDITLDQNINIQDVILTDKYIFLVTNK
jgi:hypothetical protein